MMAAKMIMIGGECVVVVTCWLCCLYVNNTLAGHPWPVVDWLTYAFVGDQWWPRHLALLASNTASLHTRNCHTLWRSLVKSMNELQSTHDAAGGGGEGRSFKRFMCGGETVAVVITIQCSIQNVFFCRCLGRISLSLQPLLFLTLTSPY